MNVEYGVVLSRGKMSKLANSQSSAVRRGTPKRKVKIMKFENFIKLYFLDALLPRASSFTLAFMVTLLTQSRPHDLSLHSRSLRFFAPRTSSSHPACFAYVHFALCAKECLQAGKEGAKSLAIVHLDNNTVK